MAIFPLFRVAGTMAAASHGISLALLGVALTMPASAIEPKVTRAAYNLFSDQEEQVLGKKFASDTDKKIVALRIPALVSYLETIVKKLGAETQRPQLLYHISIVDSPQINAFSQPAGYVYVYRGLLEFAWDESELAGMLAHEISHVVARHNMNRLSRYEVAQELAKRARAQGPKLQLTPVEMTAWEGAFSRSEETEADLLGFYTMLRAGWDPAGLVSAFEGIRAFTGEPDLVSQILTTHPASAERSRYLTTELKIASPPDNLRHDSDAFQVMKRLLKALPPPRGK
jgi:predicted Zn-dependent protease